MKLDKLVGDRFKEKPADCVIESHSLMMRGGYMKFVASGIFSQYMPLKRICRKIEQIIREEMDAIDGQEVLFPVALPASLWEESGRYETVGSELLRFTDRNGAPMVLGMTHEEAAVQLVREYGMSYTRYPFMIYQIQTKFRDEARPRAGLIRVREFTMKDAYSFHTSQEDLEVYYKKCFDAYNRIFARAGIPEVVTVQSDSGMMGGSISHEYMLLTPVGEDTIALCTECDYRANMEAAECVVQNDATEPMQELKIVETPEASSIEAVCNFLGVPIEKSCKAVVYQKNMTDEYVIVFLRGDFEVNETKLRNYIREEIHPGVITEDSGIAAGFIGPYGLKGNFTVVYDRSLEGTRNLCCGANKKDYHYTGFNISRECGTVKFVDVAKIKEGGVCPHCGKHSIQISRGIEVGNIFQLGTKYTKTMGMQYLDKEGNLQYPIMGCYGIGVGRLAASVCEAHRDEYGPIWPISIAPWQVHLCCLRVDNPAVRSVADDIYVQLQKKGIEVIYDDRDVRAGVMFSDADLLGVPIRIVVSPRSLAENLVELSTRDKKVNRKVLKEAIVSETSNLIELLWKELEANV
ncbi:MAG: proline--tRNA ligase [Clostridiales bacterium]|jgi:proline--tRNA ligase|nr:proline--tRNA ligase [Clostridiales bacterium]